jgi:murein DD-endopeptidase MepM/ murein hydrolase activator NlpD
MMMAAEGTYDPGRPEMDPYSVIVGYGTLPSFDDHPRQQLCTDRWCSDAAGAYQFLSTTWDGLKARFDHWPTGPAFGPEAQDWGFLYLHGLTNGHWNLRSAIALADGHLWIDHGKWSRAVFCDSNQWASLPGENIGAATGQHTKAHTWLWEQFTWELEGLLGQRRNVAFPIQGQNPDTATLTSRYGYRRHPIHRDRRFHAGDDYAAPTGTPLVATEDCQVSFAGDRGDGYGNCVEFVPVTDPTMEIKYAHCDRVAVQSGQMAAAGEVVGTVGSTGNSTGPHLHIERRKFGQLLSPHRYLMQSLWF